MEAKPLLLIDDDKELVSLLSDYLGREGYEIEAAFDGHEGLKRALTGNHKLIILDIMLPGIDGFEVLKQLRQTLNVPVLMLTAKGEEVDRIVGLELGADDYLPKPFNPRELVARIKAVLRRTEISAHDEAGGKKCDLQFGELRIDAAGYRAFHKGEDLNLTAIEFAFLKELACAPGRVLTRDMLLDRVRGREFEVFDRSIDVHISHIRQKLGDDPREPKFIKTVRGIGYMFVAEKE